MEQEQPRDSTLVVRKPPGSNVVLTKNANSLEILIPPGGFTLQVRCLGLFATFMFLPTLVSLTFSVLLSFSPAVLLSPLVMLPFITFIMLRAVLFALFGRVRLCLNQQQISLTYELFGFKRHIPPPCQKQNISQLEYTEEPLGSTTIPSNLTRI